MYMLNLQKAEKPEVQLPTSIRSQKKQGNSRKRLFLLHRLHWRLGLCGSQQTVEFLKRWEYQTTLPVSWETCMQIKKQHLEQDMEQQIGSKLGKEYAKAVYCYSAYLTHM